MFIAELFTVAERWENPKYPSTDEQINKIWCIHLMEESSAIKGVRLFTSYHTDEP